MKVWKRLAISAGIGLAVTAVGIFAALQGFRSAANLLAPGGYFTTRVLFAHYHAESHMIGIPSGPEIVSIILVNTLLYGAVAYLLISVCRRSPVRSK